jgi:hypothetical protein
VVQSCHGGSRPSGVNISGAGGMTGDEGSSEDGYGMGDGYSRSLSEGGNRGDSSALFKGGQGVGE